MNTLLSTALSKNSIQLSENVQTKLMQYLDIMTKWNKAYNLTNITNPKDMVYLHIVDSLIIQPYLHGERLIDIGTGAGLPGIPLAIVEPERQWTLLDKNSKKTRFLTQAIAELGLKNITVIHSRTEDFHPAEGFDSILSRAFSTLSQFVNSTAHLLKPNGVFLAMKGKYPADEIKALPAEFHLQKVVKLDIKGMNVERHLLCLSQQKSSEG